jgi:hypothetical protein
VELGSIRHYLPIKFVVVPKKMEENVIQYWLLEPIFVYHVEFLLYKQVRPGLTVNFSNISFMPIFEKWQIRALYPVILISVF